MRWTSESLFEDALPNGFLKAQLDHLGREIGFMRQCSPTEGTAEQLNYIGRLHISTKSAYEPV
ncbi:unnamed protein product [marine sediment metagenome]|uniref:Uncharacterized protein n=1 Tax=marine sediment metagenome TaxID=412755 RepID=X1SN99_9ZZZZ